MCGLEKNFKCLVFSLFSSKETLAYDLLLLAANKGIRQFSVEGGDSKPGACSMVDTSNLFVNVLMLCSFDIFLVDLCHPSSSCHVSVDLQILAHF